MPCDQQREYSSTLNAANVGTLRKALANMGFKTERRGGEIFATHPNFYGYLRITPGTQGAVSSNDNGILQMVPKIQREYAKTSVLEIIERKGWQEVKQSPLKQKPQQVIKF